MTKTHDYTLRCWGLGISAGDYLILPDVEHRTTRYRVDSIKYRSDPRDMWSAEATFAPRPFAVA